MRCGCGPTEHDEVMRSLVGWLTLGGEGSVHMRARSAEGQLCQEGWLDASALFL